MLRLLVGHISNSGPVLATTVSFWVGIVATALGVLLAAGAVYVGFRHIRQLDAARLETERLREETFAVLRLHRVIVTNPKLEEAIQNISSNFSQIEARKDNLQSYVARRDLEKATELLRMGAQGHITIGPEAFSPATTLGSILLDHTDKGDAFWASSMVLPSFWENAASYVRQQVDAINSRYVKVHRVFIFDTVAEYSDAQAQEQMKLQADAGIDVQCVIRPYFVPQDLVVVRRRTPPLLDDAEPIPDKEVDWTAVYAMQCRVGADKQIDHVDLWSMNEVQSPMVKRTWWALQAIFARATPFPLGVETPDGRADVDVALPRSPSA
jgi:hypothetical protein